MTAIVKSVENLPTFAEGKVSNLYVDESGRLHVVSAGGGGGGDASAAKQDEQTALLDLISNGVGSLDGKAVAVVRTGRAVHQASAVLSNSWTNPAAFMIP
jgi:hypothetical protein